MIGGPGIRSYVSSSDDDDDGEDDEEEGLSEGLRNEGQGAQGEVALAKAEDSSGADSDESFDEGILMWLQYIF